MAATSNRFTRILNRRFPLGRKQPRAVVAWAVTVFSNNRTLQGRVENIGRGGALLCLTEPPEPAAGLRLVVRIPGCSEVVTAKAEVVRSFTLKPHGEQQFPVAVAVKFTEISEKNIRLLAGVLMPEWQQDYLESREPAAAGGSRKPVLTAAVLALLVAAAALGTAFLPLITGRSGKDQEQIRQVAERLQSIETELKSLHSADLSLETVAAKIDTLKDELDTVKTTLPEKGKVDQLVERLEHSEITISALDSGEAVPEEMAAESAVAEVLPAEAGAEEVLAAEPAVDDDPPLAQPANHVVQKGENLYRISLKYHLRLDYLRRVNGLDGNSQIYPGQTLVVK